MSEFAKSYLPPVRDGIRRQFIQARAISLQGDIEHLKDDRFAQVERITAVLNEIVDDHTPTCMWHRMCGMFEKTCQDYIDTLSRPVMLIDTSIKRSTPSELKRCPCPAEIDADGHLKKHHESWCKYGTVNKDSVSGR